MKSFIIVFSLLVLGCSGGNGTDAEPRTQQPTPNPIQEELPEVENTGFDMTISELTEWELLWEEAFDSDLSKWTPWKSGAFNSEYQLYRSQNLHLKDGFLLVESKRESASGPTDPFNPALRNFDFTSGRIETNREFGPQQDGGILRISARIRLPEGEGLWPAFWSYNNPWPTKGEIDYLEYRGHEPYHYEANFHYGNNVNQVETDAIAQKFRYESTTKLSDDFHVYEIEWSQDRFVMRFDGEVVHTYTASQFAYVEDFYDKEHRIVLNLAIGGDFFKTLNRNDIPDRSFMYVDWVRVFKKK